MIQRALVIAPHPDDEINLAGQLIIKMNKLGIETYVMYTTNGDAEPKIGNKRILEAIMANGVLGIDESHVIFLGYPNEWKIGSPHIYNASDDEELVSKLGKTETNSISSHPEYCFQKEKIHHKFTRRNFKNDFKHVIQSLNADLLIAPEFDSHQDHRAASLMFDEIMGEVLKENIEYKPIILKKYIHEGVWYGPKDYYQMLPTKTEGPREYAGGMHDLDSPCFKWDDRLIIPAEKETLTTLLRDNVIYKAAKQHKVTTAWYEMQRVINSDIVYWTRRSDNMALNAHIEVSSGDKTHLNDFKLYDCQNTLERLYDGCSEYSFCWIPDNDDIEKQIIFSFSCKTYINSIAIYESFSAKNHIKKIQIIDNKKVIAEVELKKDGSATVISLDNLYTKTLSFKVIEWIGIPAISEIEIYGNYPNRVLLEHVDCKDVENAYFKIIQRLEHFWFMMKFLFVFKIKYEIRKRLYGKSNK